jgi:hypothetical protein
VGLIEVRFFPALKKILSRHDGKELGFDFALASVSGFPPKKRNASASDNFLTARRRALRALAPKASLVVLRSQTTQGG